MGKRNNKNKRFNERTKKKPGRPLLPEETKKWIFGIVIFILALIIALSFFDLAGVAGKAIMKGLVWLIGKSVFVTPLILISGGLIFFNTKYDKFLAPTVLAIIILILGVSVILETLNGDDKNGGYVGYFVAWPFLKFFGTLVTRIIFGGVTLVGVLIFWHLFKKPHPEEEQKKQKTELEKEKKPSLINKIFAPKFKVKEVEPRIKETSIKIEEPELELKTQDVSKTEVKKAFTGEYKLPPLELLENEKGKPAAGDTVTNSAIIKKTLENFGIQVEMSEINIGPTVTQYTLKPGEGIKLSKITTLSNNLSLALASHPLRIEAPIPGKSLVGIEVPNKERCQVRLRDLLSNQNFQKIGTNLTFVLGKDVSGNPRYADLSRMPHLLVAGSTGTGKTIFLNTLILSLLYQNSPEFLRIILIDPKRVEFSAYHDLPHLLGPVIFDSQKAVNAFNWLISEMVRRFDILSTNGSRDISSYNNKISKGDNGEYLPYIILIVDELADLMAARGREVEAGIVRLAQMARAVGIHLILATQRPSVEVITGLIKANITSRVTFQVASQVDSRTVLDMAGAEKLLGAGDLLFISAEVVKPRRMQAPYASEKEVRKVVNWIKSENSEIKIQGAKELIFENHLAESLEKSLEKPEGEFEDFSGEEDPLYEEAKRLAIEARKASASLFQRRLRIGYARAARLIDILEERGVVGPGEGAKPREVYIKKENEEGDWQKV